MIILKHSTYVLGLYNRRHNRIQDLAGDRQLITRLIIQKVGKLLLHIESFHLIMTSFSSRSMHVRIY